MILMVLLFIGFPAIWFFPLYGSMVVGLAVLALMFSVWRNNSNVEGSEDRFIQIGFDEEEAKIAARHKYYLLKSGEAKLFAQGAQCWKFFCIPWLIILLWKSAWLALVFPIAIFLLVRVVREVCNPRPRLEAQVAAGSSQELAKELAVLDTVYQRYNGAKR